ncbi:MAG: MecR antirepressor / ankyrin repeat family protein, partial [Caulobacteraceae bacterium]|nr:MecR antirepressor / ankyrin repeat family protein [Caulobacteraceae bacterium]
MIADIFALLARASLDISVAILVVLALRRPARRLAGAVLAYRLWLLVPLAAMAVALPPPPAELSLLPTPAAQALAPSTVALDATPLGDFIPSPGSETPRPIRPVLTLRAARSLAVILWVLGLAGVWTIVLVRQRRYLRTLGDLTPSSVSRRVFLSAASDVRPALIGSWRAFVVLPCDFHQRYDHQQSALILAHERAHLAQRHHLEGALGLFLLAAQWFNPLAYLAYRALRIDQELACDAVVLAAHPRSRAAYAEAMFRSQLSGAAAPFACQWPGKADHPFKERLTMLSSKSPSALRRRLAGGALTLLLTGGVYVAYAAEPGAPERLAAQAAGVVGSGDQLSLKIREPQGERTVKVGETYADGWTLQALTPTKATLAKDGATREVGLNPTGALARAQTDEPPSSVKTLARIDLDKRAEEAKARQPAFDQLVKDQLGPWDGKTPRMGLSLAETQRYVDYQTRGALFQVPFTDRQGPQGPNGFLSAGQVEALGADSLDYRILNQKLLDELQAS